MKKPPKNFIDQVDELIAEYLDEPNLLLILNKQLHVSNSQMYRRIKQKSGYPPCTYIRKKRLTVAQEWLKQSDAQVKEIAYRTGFQSLSYFSRCFFNEFGFRPSKFRQ